MSREERDALMRMALGRLFRLGSRPPQPGDVEQYHRVRAAILDACDPATPDYRPNAARDLHRMVKP